MPSKKINVKISEVLVERNEFQQKGLNLPHVSLTKEGVVPKSERYERDFLVKDEEKDYKVTRVGDLCYNPANLKFGVITLNEKINGIFSPIYVTFEINKKLMTNLYAKYFFIRHNFLSKLMRYQQGTVYERMSVSPEDFVRENINIHSLSEQEKIGSFLSAIDHLIENQKEKVDRIKFLKKGYLQKMFPSDGDDKPQIRFGTYKDPWNNFELVSVLDVNSGRDYKHLKNGHIPVYGTGGYMLSVSEALSRKDAIGIGRKGTIDKPFILKAPFWTVDTLFYVIPKNNNYLHFLYAIFQNTNWKKLDESTGVPSLSKRAIELKRKYVPRTDEQEKIGLFFMKLDSLLEEEQKVFETYAQLKKSYLQRIFAD
jgi:type I restriction enzyme S subunit